jgi:hypothetical protein
MGGAAAKHSSHSSPASTSQPASLPLGASAYGEGKVPALSMRGGIDSGGDRSDRLGSGRSGRSGNGSPRSQSSLANKRLEESKGKRPTHTHTHTLSLSLSLSLSHTHTHTHPHTHTHTPTHTHTHTHLNRQLPTKPCPRRMDAPEDLFVGYGFTCVWGGGE